MAAPPQRNHSPTIRLLGEQVSTALKACGELRADLRTLDGSVDELTTQLAVLQQKPPVCEGCQALQIEIARLKERMSIAIGILSVLQVISMGIAAYLAAR
jgi:hypothetical protein